MLRVQEAGARQTVSSAGECVQNEDVGGSCYGQADGRSGAATSGGAPSLSVHEANAQVVLTIEALRVSLAGECRDATHKAWVLACLGMAERCVADAVGRSHIAPMEWEGLRNHIAATERDAGAGFGRMGTTEGLTVEKWVTPGVANAIGLSQMAPMAGEEVPCLGAVGRSHIAATGGEVGAGFGHMDTSEGVTMPCLGAAAGSHLATAEEGAMQDFSGAERSHHDPTDGGPRPCGGETAEAGMGREAEHLPKGDGAGVYEMGVRREADELREGVAGGTAKAGMQEGRGGLPEAQEGQEAISGAVGRGRAPEQSAQPASSARAYDASAMAHAAPPASASRVRGVQAASGTSVHDARGQTSPEGHWAAQQLKKVKVYQKRRKSASHDALAMEHAVSPAAAAPRGRGVQAVSPHCCP